MHIDLDIRVVYNWTVDIVFQRVYWRLPFPEMKVL
jgi:hypothetical protein